MVHPSVELEEYVNLWVCTETFLTRPASAHFIGSVSSRRLEVGASWPSCKGLWFSFAKLYLHMVPSRLGVD
jgi:hypothetical protein